MSVEQEAIRYVMKYEKKRGNKPKDVSKSKKGYDIESSRRKIEVKGVSNPKPGFVIMNQYNFRGLQKEKNFWLYIVYNIPTKKHPKRKPQLIMLKKYETLERARFIYSWEIPLWKKDFDKVK